MSEIKDEVVVLDAGAPNAPEGPTACCTTGPVTSRVQPAA